MTHASFVWNELATTDVEGAKVFYEQTLGWTFEPFALPEGEYWVARAGETLVAGLSGLALGALEGARESYWFAFIGVEDVDARVAAARRAGATILREPEDVPNVGRVAVLRDPTGAPIGWMTGVESQG